MSPLAARMHALADSGHPRAEELRAAADEFDQRNAEFGDRETTKRMLGAWARARKLWCECSGEPLV